MSTALATLSPMTLPMVAAADVLESFLAGRKRTTWKTYSEALTDFARFLHVRDAAAAVEALVSCDHGTANRIGLAYRAQMTERGLSASTVNLRLSALKSLVRLARQIGRISWCLDVDGVKAKAYRDTRGPSQEDSRKLLAMGRRLAATSAEGKRNLALVLLCRLLGTRRGECVSLDLKDFDASRPAVFITGKGQLDQEWVTLTKQTVDALNAWIEVRGDQAGPLFIRLDRAASGDLERLTGDSVCRITRKMSRKAGLESEVRPHGLRHAAITEALDATGGDVRRVRKFSRHAKLETVLLYDDNRRDDAGTIARLLDSRN